MKVTFGYIRISNKTQNLDRQINTMKERGVEDRYLYTDVQSGKDFDREGYKALKRAIREGDLIYVDALDRLGRDYDGIIREWKDITQHIKADIVALDQESLFDSRKFREMGDIGKLMEDQLLSLLAYVADTERKRMLRRQREGIEAAKLKGKNLGRKKIEVDNSEWDRQIRRVVKGEIPAAAAYRELGISASTFYRRIKEENIELRRNEGEA